MEERPELEAETLPDIEFSSAEPDEKAKETVPGLWQRLRRFFLPSPEERREAERQRLLELSIAIERYPEAAVNYLLRGELHLQQKQWALAEEDLSEALRLADSQYSQERWGISAQAIADRARRGLDDILRYS